jgi:hypothetical protein
MAELKSLQPKPSTLPQETLAPLIPSAPASHPAKKPPTLTFTDGLNFGCGFWVAGFLFTVVAVPAAVSLASVILAVLAGAGR